MPWPVGCGSPAKPRCSMLAPASDGCEATPPSIIPMRVPRGRRPLRRASAPANGQQRSAGGLVDMVEVGLQRGRRLAQPP